MKSAAIFFAGIGAFVCLQWLVAWNDQRTEREIAQERSAEAMREERPVGYACMESRDGAKIIDVKCARALEGK